MIAKYTGNNYINQHIIIINIYANIVIKNINKLNRSKITGINVN